MTTLALRNHRFARQPAAPVFCLFAMLMSIIYVPQSWTILLSEMLGQGLSSDPEPHVIVLGKSPTFWVLNIWVLSVFSCGGAFITSLLQTISDIVQSTPNAENRD